MFTGVRMVLKIVIAAAITIVILFFIVSSGSILGNMLSEAGDRVGIYLPIPSFGSDVNRTIVFSMVLDDYSYENFSANADANITIKSSGLNLNVNNADITTDRQIFIVGYKGFLSLSDGFELDGSFEEMRLGDVIFKTKGRVKGSGSYEIIDIEGLSVSEIILEGRGDVQIDKLKIEVDGEKIKLIEPKGSFAFGKSLAANGMSKQAEVGGLAK